MTQPDNVDLSDAVQPYIAPRTEVEHLIADVWAEALGRDRIGVHDDFFDLGGQSLQVTRVINRIQLLTGLEVDLRAFFEAPTVAGLADHVLEQFAALPESEKNRAEA
ncbi:phosphopantetheine-binding protein [Micromonospora sp. WMMA1363]|uniref:phosphopantetheine-binding protein n=1 Tax=Micromonospora sp. WMMA1363 TaxID=3053985 RepID=UPI00259C6914|nr:phosphopantetheine-binding protein [Micromonospora sp. WMMA1363]MDM4719725.1 phosphopantetheine-binding protein [Micromonospora sp. WMMA1363]